MSCHHRKMKKKAERAISLCENPTNLQQGINNCKKDSSKINLADNG